MQMIQTEKQHSSEGYEAQTHSKQSSFEHKSVLPIWKLFCIDG
jgi:hypothetical protein